MLQNIPMKTALLLLTFILAADSYAEGRNLPIQMKGEAVLNSKSRELTPSEITSPEIQQLIDDLIVTLIKTGGVGIAASQVKQPLRIFVMQLLPGIPLTVAINPKIEPVESAGKMDSLEACHSIHGYTFVMKRFKKIKLTYLNRKGESVTEELEGYRSMITQHENDHLDGKLNSDKVKGVLNKEKYFTAVRM